MFYLLQALIKCLSPENLILNHIGYISPGYCCASCVVHFVTFQFRVNVICAKNYEDYICITGYVE